MSPAEQYAPGVSDIMERAAGFSGREWVFERIHDWLKDPAGGRFYLLTASPGAGKTAIAARLVQFSRGAATPPASCPLFQPGFVDAIHFCSANVGPWIDPTDFTRSVSLQLARSHPAFAALLVQAGERSVNIQVVQNVEKAKEVKGVVIENLVLTGPNPQAAFNSTIADPLTNAAGAGDTRPITIVVDALDEALVFKGDVNILTLLSSVNKLPANVRFILTSRPDARVQAVFPQAAGFLLSGADNNDANTNDIRAFLDTRLADHPHRGELVDEIVRKAERNFQYVTFLLKQMTANPGLPLTGQPAGLHPLYRESLTRVISLEGWRQKSAPIMGLLSVAREALSKEQLRAYSKQGERDVSDSLRDLRQFIEEMGSPAAYRLYHQSVSDFLREPDLKSLAGTVENQFYLPAGEWHRAIAAYYMPNGPASWRQWDPYGFRYTTSHLAHAVEGEVANNRHPLIARMVDLITNQRFVSQQLRAVDDLPGLRHDLVKAVRYAARDTDPAGVASVTRAALALVEFNAAQLRPEPLFEMAAAGEVERAAQRLALFDVSQDWSTAALLALGWWGSAANPAEARKVIDKAPVSGGSLELLQRYAQAAVDGTPPPVSKDIRDMIDSNGKMLVSPFLLTPGDPQLEARASSAVDRLGGNGADPELLQQEAALTKPFAGTPVLGQRPGAQQAGYLAEKDAPVMVAAAALVPGADRFLRQYIAIHSGYQYVHYRNASLWFVLESVLWHPEPQRVREMVRDLVATALAGSLIDFREALPLTVVALQSARGKPDVAAGLYLRARELASAVQTDAEQIPRRGDPRTQDPWGSHKRRLAAHAEIAARIQGQSGRARDALVEASRLLRSFAGFQAPASLVLAEAWEIVEPANAAAQTAEVERALRAAHNIQDPSFSVRMVSRCNAARKDWWGRPLKDLRSVVNRLFDGAAGAEFTALHYVGDKFEHRAPGSVEIPASTIQAASLEELKAVHRVGLEDLQRVNPQVRNASDRLPVGTEVRIPDPGFATWIAGRLSAAVLVDAGLFDEDRIELLQLLAAVAAPNATILDRVLARLAMAAPRADAGMLDALEEAAGPAQIQSTPGFEGNLPA
jgi:hypothetical protein